MTVAVVLFTRDLRVHDNPALQGAVPAADRVVPLFVLDEAILQSTYNCPNRAHFLAGALQDLDAVLKERGGDGLVVRRGDVAEQVGEVAAETGAESVHVAGDYSAYARRRQQRLTERLEPRGCRLRVHDEALVVLLNERTKWRRDDGARRAGHRGCRPADGGAGDHRARPWAPLLVSPAHWRRRLQAG